MNHDQPHRDRACAAAELLESSVVRRVLSDVVEWPDDRRPRDVDVERCWPDRHGGFSFEWSFRLGDRNRHAIFGHVSSAYSSDGGPDRTHAVVTPDGVRGVRVRAADRNLLIHSPDCDPRLRGLSECLDADRMASRLGGYWADSPPAAEARSDSICCRLLGYRAGRRAAIAYRRLGLNGSGLSLVGKIRRRRGGSSPAERNAGLNEQLAWFTNRRVRVPAVVGEVPDLHMTLAAEARGRLFGDGGHSFAADSMRCMDALAALHNTRMDLPAFSARDEFAVVRRWYEALRLMDPAAAARTESIVDRLERLAEGCPDTRHDTIHRDFYERQLVFASRSTTIVDLDTLAVGDPGLDVGNVLAHLLLATLSAGRSRSDFESLAAALTQRYESVRQTLDRESLAFYSASAAFRVGAVHALRTRTREYSPLLFTFAGDVASAAGRGLDTLPVFLRARVHGTTASGPRTAAIAKEIPA